MDDIDLTHMNYLGLRHARDELAGWQQLGRGIPAGLAPDTLEAELAPRLAELIGGDAAFLSRSTLHAFHGLFGGLSPHDDAVFVCAQAYPIAARATAIAATRGVPILTFAEPDAASLASALDAAALGNRRPLIVLDGVSGDGHTAALPELVELARSHGGWVVVDDTQALGLLGAAPTSSAAWGSGGGGSLRWHGLPASDVLLVSSMSKAFGVPVAVVTGDAARVDWFRGVDFASAHCSPPSAPELLAVRRALDVNAEQGDALRERLLRNIRRWRERFWRAGIASSAAVFPVQRVRLPPAIDGEELDRELRSRGVRAYVPRGTRDAGVFAILTAELDTADVERAASVVLEALEELACRRCWGECAG